MSEIRAGILGTGMFVPDRVVTNDDMAKIVDTSDEWITERTGIKERRFAADDVFTSDLATEAAKIAIANAGLTAKDIDYILVGTASPDNSFPNTANYITKNLDVIGTPALDVSTACSGFIYCLELATSLVNSGKYRNVLALGAETLSKITDFRDRSTCVLFGDGAGAVVIGNGGHEVIATKCYSHFNYDALNRPSSGMRIMPSTENIEEGYQYIRMNGREVYRFVVSTCVEMLAEALESNNLKPEQIDLFIPHQANAVMLDFAKKKVGLENARMVININKYGNTSSASIPMALAETVDANEIKEGELVLLMGFGGGLSSGYAIVRW
ncbi:MAG: ketoacyl-ACP synthase III [Planctomycetes bacterium]|nr:ketoacyl-ACP synthase III [Planctomycetota bacterium]